VIRIAGSPPIPLAAIFPLNNRIITGLFFTFPLSDAVVLLSHSGPTLYGVITLPSHYRE
jgi:hypothetical protein